jgi:hypothetical protein
VKVTAPGGDVWIKGERLDENVKVVASGWGVPCRTVLLESSEADPEPDPEELGTAPTASVIVML